MRHQNLLEQISDAVHRLRLQHPHEVIRDAYLHHFGDRQPFQTEAHLAARRFKKRGTLCENAIHALQMFLNARFGWPKLPMPAAA